MYSKHTEIFGILGYPLGHTLSPWIHNTLFQLSGYDGVYLVFENNRWNEIGLRPLLELGVRGVSVTIPFKEWAYSQANIVCKASQTMGSSNTLLFREGIEAVNTDGTGAVTSILKCDPKLLDPNTEKQILVLGSGGSAKGIIFSIAESLQKKVKQGKIQRKVKILARNESATKEILNSLGNPEWLGVTTKKKSLEEAENYDLIIHTTPVGMKGFGGEPILNSDFFTKKHTLFDIVYNPLETDLVKQAKKKKAEIIPGYHMLLYQGIRQFELFTNIQTKQKWIRKVESLLLKQLKNRN
ncbi:shikimate dehydrogenase [Leptospira bandrabouensis]|uniref:shikimate dehydrogenase family protein n=1 Tax=Leptospira bandrabouensis TaxID=2484903 RepID=UPI00223DBBA0|nr:shikimate dehydrogenase [Leptospira bandrabouensis]MCW7458367.1 shikimate dehydrogenase [Leptospira bandrabouensis]MCW7477029.1 shikimate dehydrogenase [Leptospira bandrabouensis]MCW7484711.1 shikimate dehydrogenase [Leptospira bandrabouensis]